MLESDRLVAHHIEVAMEEAANEWRDLRRIEPDHTLVKAAFRQKNRDGRVYLPGQVFYLENERVAAAVAGGFVSVVEDAPADFWAPEGRILGAEDVAGVMPRALGPSEGALTILAGVGYDPGNAAFRLHTAVNEHTKHAMMFARWRDTNPHCSLRQKDGERDVGELRDALDKADVLHCHVGLILINNLGLIPRAEQCIIRHYHGSKPGGTHIDADFDRCRDLKLLGARLSLVAEAESLGLAMDWSPIPVPVARYRALRDTARRIAGWVPLEGRATDERPLRVAHSPTEMAIKGTDALRKAVRALELAGVPIELDLIHGVSFAESLRRRALCDVTFDSFWLGIQGSGLEGGAMEMPVVAGDQSVANLYEQKLGFVPYTFADDQLSLTSVLERMAMEPAFRENEAYNTAQYVARVHDYAAVAARYEVSLSKWLKRDDLLTPSID